MKFNNFQTSLFCIFIAFLILWILSNLLSSNQEGFFSRYHRKKSSKSKKRHENRLRKRDSYNDQNNGEDQDDLNHQDMDDWKKHLKNQEKKNKLIQRKP